MVKDNNVSFMKRPAIWASSAFMTGIAAGVGTAENDVLIPAVVILLSLYAVIAGTVLFTNTSTCRAC